MTTVAPYPVRVDATLDSPLSRWLWLVKWFLAIPHFIVLAFLWVAFIALSIVAFFAILLTGRYPRGIFAFNVGVLRWTWRVQYYTYGALGTDRYPPFSLDERLYYPAHLEIAYPQRLSRGLVLVKWLLGIPHYVIVGLFVGGGAWAAWQIDGHAQNWTGGGLIGLLVLVAAVVLAVTGRYPRGLFDFVLGLNRWVLRVAAYGALMTDAYPPFRLDMGEHEPASSMTLPPPPPSMSAASPPLAPPPTADRWTAGRIVSVVVGSLLLLTSFALLAGGGVALWADQHRDGRFVTSGIESYDSTGYAVTSEQLTLDAAAVDWGWQSDLLGDVRVRATAASDATPLFVGIAPTEAVDRYLRDVARTVYGDFVGRDESLQLRGAGAADPPGDMRFWVAQATGTGTQSIVWPVRSGDWTVVVMNADGSRGVHARADLGATVPALPWIAAGLLVAGGVLVLAGALFVAVPIGRMRR